MPDADIVMIEVHRRNLPSLWASVSADRAEEVLQYRWHSRRSGGTLYAATSVRKPDGKFTALYLHRLLHPEWLRVDHVDHDGLNNCNENLRDGGKGLNDRNRSAVAGTSRLKGVSWNSNARKWRAAICVQGKSFHIGYYTTEEEAARAYDARAHSEFGEYALLNYVNHNASLV